MIEMETDSTHVLIATFNDGRNHLESFLGDDSISAVRRYDDGLARSEHKRFSVDQDFGGSLNDLNKGIERRYFLCEPRPRIEGDGADTARCFSIDSFSHHRMRDIFQYFRNHENFRFFNVYRFQGSKLWVNGFFKVAYDQAIKLSALR